MASDLNTGLFEKKRRKAGLILRAPIKTVRATEQVRAFVNQNNIGVFMPVLPVQNCTIRAEALWLVCL